MIDISLNYYPQLDKIDPVKMKWMPDEAILKEIFEYGPPKVFELALKYEVVDDRVIEGITSFNFVALQNINDYYGYKIIKDLKELEEGEPGITQPSAPTYDIGN